MEISKLNEISLHLTLYDSMGKCHVNWHDFELQVKESCTAVFHFKISKLPNQFVFVIGYESMSVCAFDWGNEW